MVSIICCYNRKQDLDRLLLKSLRDQNAEYELILVDNSQKKYPSAAEALNAGAKNAAGDVLAFAHQDIVFKTPSALKELVQKFKEYASAGDVCGVAGAVSHNQSTVVIQGSGFNTIISSSFYEEAKEVESVDECLIMMHRETWDNHPFDCKVCPSWHFYGAEVSYFARCSGHKVLVLNADILHESLGNLDDTFYYSLIQLRNRYKGELSHIVTTCIYMDINPYWEYIHRFLGSFIRKYGRIAKRKLKQFCK